MCVSLLTLDNYVFNFKSLFYSRFELCSNFNSNELIFNCFVKGGLMVFCLVLVVVKVCTKNSELSEIENPTLKSIVLIN